MKQRYLGTTGLKVSRLGLGTMLWGTDTDEHDAADQLSAFVDAGGTLLDTAAGYGNGASETVIGTLLGRSVERDDVVIATKGGIGRPRGERVVDVSRGGLLRDLDASLDRLGVDHVDLWQVHTWSDDVPLEETLTAADAAVSSGRARYVGISNYSGWQTAQAATHQQAAPGRARLASTQVEYSLLQRGIEREVAPAAEALGPGHPLLVAAGPRRADRQVPHRHTGGLTRRVTDLRALRRCAPQPARRRHRRGGLSGRRRARAVPRSRSRWPGCATSRVSPHRSLVRAPPPSWPERLTVEDVTLPEEIADALDDVSAPELGYPEA